MGTTANFANVGIGPNPPPTTFVPVTDPTATGATFYVQRNPGAVDGLDLLAPAAVLDVAVQTSQDGGTTWTTIAEAQAPGGPQTDKSGNPVETWEFDADWPGEGPVGQVQIVANLTGAATVTVSGSITTRP